jgi:hypothetical protein
MNVVNFGLGGIFKFECYDKDGNLKWKDDAKNAVTTAGRCSILDVSFHAASQIATWYIGLISATSYTTGLAAGDTMASHGGWAEDATYDEATRVEWTEGAANAGVITNGTACNFTMSGSTTIKGAFLTSVSTKSDNTGTLFCTALFTGGDQAVSDGDILKVTYTITVTAT